MSKDLVQQGERAPAATIYEAFGRMAADPTIPIERLAALMELQIKAEDRQAEKDFNAALARAIQKMPRVSKDGKNTGPAGWRYTTIDTLDREIRPIYTAEGFSLSFLSEPCAQGIMRVAILRHVGGHHQESRLQLAADKGPGRNDIQAMGSSLSYADRYLTRGLFNIISLGEDDDGKKHGVISEEQAMSIEDMFHAASMGKDRIDKFLEIMRAPTVRAIQASDFQKAMTQLKNAVRKAGGQ